MACRCGKHYICAEHILPPVKRSLLECVVDWIYLRLFPVKGDK